MILLDNTPLHIENVFQHLDRILGIRRLVSQTPQANREVGFIIARPLNAGFHELCDVVSILRPIPGTHDRLIPLVRRPLHGLVVRGRNDYAVVIRQLLVARIIGEKDVAGRWCPRLPHGGPKIVRLEAQKEVEHMGVELGVERVSSLVVVLGPPGIQRGLLVVDEEAAVLDGGLTLSRCFAQGEYLRVLLGRNIREPVESITLGQFSVGSDVHRKG